MGLMLIVTVLIFLCVRHIAIKLKSPLFNPLVISVLILIPILLLSQQTYQQYMQQTALLNDLLAMSVVALAYPLYELLPQIKERWRSIMFITFCGSLTAMLTGFFIAYWMGATQDIAASVLPKSVSTPIAVMIAKSTGGIPSIAAFCVVLVGTLGAIVGHQLLALFRIRLAAAKGLAIGTVSHAVGTARCLEISSEEGAYSSLALVLCGVMTSLIAPFLFPILVYLCY